MEEFNTLMSFVPNLESTSVLQLGINQDLTQALINNNVNKIVVVDSDQQKLNAVKTQPRANVQFLDQNMNTINLQNQRFDFVFFNSLLLNSTDEQFVQVIANALANLTNGGYLFFRESCIGSSQSSRTPITLIDLVQAKEYEENGKRYGFDLVFAKPNRSFSSNELNADKVSFLFKKIVLENHHGFKTLKEFMDHKQYSRNGVLRYEKIFGEGFVSTGGIDTTLEFLEQLDLKPNQKVLDVGCGIGGGNFLMADKYGVECLAMDLSSNMVGIAWERAQAHKNSKTQFEIGDICKQKFPENYFDVIYSRDTILHIDDKEGLFAKFKKWLKPNGKIFISDYCCGPKPWSKEFETYVAGRGYDLRTPAEYGQIFVNLGFRNVKALDRTDLFVRSLKNELKKMEQIRGEFVKEFSEEDFNYLVNGWKAKLERTAAGHQRWGTFYCEK